MQTNLIRQILLMLLGVAILGGAYYIANAFISNKKIPTPREKKIVTSVFTEAVENSSVPITVSTNGMLTAKYRMELYSEVQGVFDGSDRDFKPGAYYEKGSILLKINSDEHLASMISQKSALFNQIVLLLPDLRLDYPEAFPDWESYVKNFELEGTLKPLPTPKSEREKLFIAGRNVYTPYYAAKNLEERMAKYVIRAPYNGVLTEALLTTGTLIRSGQKLGEFINPNTYELQVPISTAYSDLIKVGQNVALHDIEKTKSWEGRVIRINSIVDQATQSTQAYIQVSGTGLKEGMYLEADLEAREVMDAFEIDRKLLLDNGFVYIVPDSTLQLAPVDPVFFKESSVVVTGLSNGTRLLAKPVPGSHEGMPVQVLQDLAGTK